MHSGPGGGGAKPNAQTSGRPFKDQRSLKLPRKRLICYLTLSGKTTATAMDKELNTEYETSCPSASVRTYKKLQLTGSFRIRTAIRFSFLLPLSAPGPDY